MDAIKGSQLNMNNPDKQHVTIRELYFFCVGAELRIAITAKSTLRIVISNIGETRKNTTISTNMTLYFGLTNEIPPQYIDHRELFGVKVHKNYWSSRYAPDESQKNFNDPVFYHKEGLHHYYHSDHCKQQHGQTVSWCWEISQHKHKLYNTPAKIRFCCLAVRSKCCAMPLKLIIFIARQGGVRFD